MVGGYDDGYRRCPCFWGSTPAALVVRLADLLSDHPDPHVVDVGCGDGKNAQYLAGRGVSVDAFDISELAVANARQFWPSTEYLRWAIADARSYDFGVKVHNAIVASGSLHCLTTEQEVADVIRRAKQGTMSGGYHVVQAFNDRDHDLSGHGSDFRPLLLAHDYFVEAYADWDLLEVVDADIRDRHPHTNVDHHHSVTRMLVRNPQ